MSEIKLCTMCKNHLVCYEDDKCWKCWSIIEDGALIIGCAICQKQCFDNDGEGNCFKCVENIKDGIGDKRKINDYWNRYYDRVKCEDDIPSETEPTTHKCLVCNKIGQFRNRDICMQCWTFKANEQKFLQDASNNIVHADIDVEKHMPFVDITDRERMYNEIVDVEYEDDSACKCEGDEHCHICIAEITCDCKGTEFCRKCSMSERCSAASKHLRQFMRQKRFDDGPDERTKWRNYFKQESGF